MFVIEKFQRKNLVAILDFVAVSNLKFPIIRPGYNKACYVLSFNNGEFQACSLTLFCYFLNCTYRFMIKHIRSLYQLIQTSSAVDKLKDWNEVEERIKNQMPLRLLSCVQLASKLSSHCKVMVKWLIHSVCVECHGRHRDFFRGRGARATQQFSVTKLKLKFHFDEMN